MITVLLIDDNPSFLRIATRFLQSQADLEVIASTNEGKKALEMAMTLQPDVALIDLYMPELHGLDVIPHLRRAAPAVRIIALTLLDADGYRQAALDAGADDFVPKVTLNTHLLPAIRRLAQTREQEARSN